jgi:hypothetical protein
MSKVIAWCLAGAAAYSAMQLASGTSHPVQNVHITPPLAPITTPAIVIPPIIKYTPPPMDYSAPTTTPTIIHDTVV